MVRTYSDHRKIYSVDLMLAYINIYKPKVKNVDMNKLLEELEYKGWEDRKKKLHFSALDVIENPTKNKLYKEEMDRIENANLKFPIILSYNNIVIDGVHRLAKAYLCNKKKIRAFIFTDKQMDKFLIDKTGNWDKVEKLDICYFIKLFHERFCS